MGLWLDSVVDSSSRFSHLSLYKGDTTIWHNRPINSGRRRSGPNGKMNGQPYLSPIRETLSPHSTAPQHISIDLTDLGRYRRAYTLPYILFTQGTLRMLHIGSSRPMRVFLT